ncbi:MAG: hypothetical protein J6Y77_07710 [Paludibacteraceae bacterium]|nr:hypothetical protein [Paludibacteraceae bacterium]
MKKMLLRLAVVLAASLCCCACNSNHTRFYTRLAESERLDLAIDRFDQDLYALDTVQLRQKYGSYLDLYLWQVMGLRSCDSLPRFLADSNVRRLSADVTRIYTPERTDAVANELSQAFSYYKHYFPQGQVPRLLFHFSGFGPSHVVADSLLSTSIDNYLGADFPDYQYIAYQYEIPTMTPEHLPIDMMRAWLTVDLAEAGFVESNGNLLEGMLYYGRLMYLLKVCFPDREEYEILGYTPEEYAWCKRHEGHVWGFVSERNELFSDDRMVQAHYLQPGPFTPGLVEQSPGCVGYFVGLKIIESYMKRNKDVDLPGLLSESDAQKILQNSYYRP